MQTLDLRNSVVGKIFVTTLVLGFLFGIYTFGKGSLSLIEREIIDDRMKKEAKVLTGEVVGYAERKISRRGRYWMPIIRVNESPSAIEFTDTYRSFDVKPVEKATRAEILNLEFHASLSILRVRDSYQAAKASLIRNDLLSCLLGLMLASLFPFIWSKRIVASAKKIEQQ
jgi:hypothetical protein